MKGIEESERRLESMIAAQAALRTDSSGLEDPEGIVNNKTLSEREKKDMLQKALNMAASNGEADRVRKILTGKARDIVDVNAVDEEGTSSLIYASCFVRTPLHRSQDPLANK